MISHSTFFLTILLFGMCSVPFSSAGLLKKSNDVFYLKKYIHQQIGIQPTRYTLGSIFGGFRAHKKRINCLKITSWKRPFLEIIENKCQKARYTNQMEIFNYLENEDKKENKSTLKYLASSKICNIHP